jgi:ATP-dependent DNA ligase
VWSRHGKDLTRWFSDVAEDAVRELPDGCVVDGELVVRGRDGHPAFVELQRRLLTTPAKARSLIAASPASLIAFDLVAVAGRDIRRQPWAARRAGRESLCGWESVLRLSEFSGGVDEARRWLDDASDTPGCDGLVVKGAGSLYRVAPTLLVEVLADLPCDQVNGVIPCSTFAIGPI